MRVMRDVRRFRAPQLRQSKTTFFCVFFDTAKVSDTAKVRCECQMSFECHDVSHVMTFDFGTTFDIGIGMSNVIRMSREMFATANTAKSPCNDTPVTFKWLSTLAKGNTAKIPCECGLLRGTEQRKTQQSCLANVDCQEEQRETEQRKIEHKERQSKRKQSTSPSHCSKTVSFNDIETRFDMHTKRTRIIRTSQLATRNASSITVELTFGKAIKC